jgi:nitrite reductase/ring-hydroxylating ferredoxin subunit
LTSAPEPRPQEEWRRVCRVDDVPLDDVRRFELPELPPVAVFNVAGTFYVTDDCCTHSQASLSDGTVEGDVVECPFHGGRFHIPTGEVVERPPRRPLKTYEVLVTGEDVLIR